MKRKQKSKHISNLIISLILLVASVICGGNFFPAFAAAETYSSVLDDLAKDPDFKVADYPDKVSDNALHVIQIAEGSNDELFVYVYQPSAAERKLVATSLNMSLSEEVDNTAVYELNLVDSIGVFQKYAVKDFAVRKDKIRYYNISAVYRAWDGDIDAPPPEGNEINEVSCPVGVVFIATTVNGDVVYDNYDVELIYVTDKYVGSVLSNSGRNRLPVTGLWDYNTDDYVDCHFAAISTNYTIDKLLSAKVSFKYQAAHGTVQTLFDWFSFNEKLTLGEERETTKELDFTQQFEFTQFGKTEMRDRIMSAAEFGEAYKNYYENGVSMKDKVAGKEWVLFFTETERRQTEVMIAGVHTYDASCTYVNSVTVLRLEFEAEGKIYNLGVIDNKQSAVKPQDPSAMDFWDRLALWLSQILKIDVSRSWAIAVFWTVIAVAAVIALIVLSILFPFVRKALLWLFNALWWIISAPFKGIAALANKIKESKDGGQ